MQWYYANEGQRQGPISADEFARLIESGVIQAGTLVWRAGMATWVPYADLGPPPMPDVASPSTEAQTTASLPVNPTSEPSVLIQGYGGFWRRLIAKIIDGFITGVLSWIILVPLFMVMVGPAGAFTPGVEPSPEVTRAMLGFQFVSFGLQTVIGLGYSLFFLRKYAATPGKMALGLKVYRSDSHPLSVGRIVGRYFAEWVSALTLGLGYLIAAFDSEKRSLHDRIADTRVVLVQN